MNYERTESKLLTFEILNKRLLHFLIKILYFHLHTREELSLLLKPHITKKRSFSAVKYMLCLRIELLRKRTKGLLNW